MTKKSESASAAQGARYSAVLRRAWVAFLPLWLVTSANCANTTILSAPLVPSPVLVGPVPCVGCAAQKVVPSGPQFTDEASVSKGGIEGWSSSTVSRLTQRVKEAGDSCRTDLVLRGIQAGAFGIGAAGLYATTSVHLSGVFLTVPNGVCSVNVGQWPGVDKPAWLGPAGPQAYPPPYPPQAYPPQAYPPQGPPPSGPGPTPAPAPGGAR
jgi:hypothetical protein